MLNITKENFNEEVLNSKGLVLVDFWATWCGPCRALGPILEDFANEYTNVKVGKINVDEQPELASQFRVMSIPTLLLFKDGEVVKKSVGLLSKDELVELTK
ncbi:MULTISPECIES: thioredoxin [Fusobacterium]|jgi:thioredoxin 1|uniref:thioredoxin n=1 Tax=Fusobacterium TaxID=848 RepID=UPI0015A53116|nr:MULTISPECIES: thioredoxin [Fusobacterium]MCF2613006.1 thioredoxin [Fusobacterium perfoetens]MDY2980868.1 thioredoxin [Fusobacterium sp.]